MKKIKIFLGGYVNFPNAQNVNCDNIARYLNKDKFEVHTMYTARLGFRKAPYPIDKKWYKENKIHLHRVLSHRYIWYWTRWCMMRFGGYDIIYLPKGESVDHAFVKKHKDLAVFLSSIEGVVGEQISGTDPVVKNNYLMMDDVFSISTCIQKSAKQCWDMDTKVLYLGVNPPFVDDSAAGKDCINNIVWIGSIIERKRPEYLMECAKQFPQLHFTMIGDGNLQTEIKSMIAEAQLDNITLTGRIPNEKVYEELRGADLLLMTSDKEGLPKVIGEAMISGVPAVYINECYDVDYITDGINGYAVSDLDTMIERIRELLDDPQKYRQMSANAVKSIQAYTWKNLIKDYESYFMEQYQKKRGQL